MPVGVRQKSWLGGGAEATLRQACGSLSAVAQQACHSQGTEKTSPAAYGDSLQTRHETCCGDDKTQVQGDRAPA
jgi:hypothetical protein